jgi:hypothetical protein
MFVKNGEDSTSFAMAMLTGAALLCYVTLLVLSSRAQSALEQETEPLLVSVPAAREPENYQDDWGAEPGWDDDPDWAGRLRQDQDPGWPQPPRGRQERRSGWEQQADWEHRAGWEQEAGWEQQAPWEQRPADWEQHQAGPPDYRPDWRERPQGPNWRL